MAQKPIALALLFSLLLNFWLPIPSGADDLLSQVQSTLGQLNPISLALGPLIDRAAAAGDSVLQNRLEQLNGIIQSAIVNLDQMLKSNIDRLDTAARDRLDQTLRILNTSIAQLQGVIGESLDKVNSYLEQNIQNLQLSAANVVATLPIPTQPLIGIGPSGLTTIKQRGTITEVTVAGSGLLKEGMKPSAYLSIPGRNVQLSLMSASMGLLQLAIPSAVLDDSPKATSYVVHLKIFNGYRFYFFGPKWSEVSFPLRICGSLPLYKATVTISAAGQLWERRVICHPQNRGEVKGYPCGFYIEHGGGNGHDQIDVCAVGTEGYEVDSAAPGSWGGLYYGAEGGDNDHSLTKSSLGCYKLYAGWNNNRGSHEWIGNVRVAQQRLKNGNCGETQTAQMDLKYWGPNQVQLDKQKALALCLEPGISASPVLSASVVISQNGAELERVNLTENVRATALGGSIQLLEDDHGLLTITANPTCRWHYDYAVYKP